MIKVKRGVKPKALVIAAAAANANLDLDFDIVITSGTDGTHMVGSKHYTGEALDFRTQGVESTTLNLWVERVKERLGPDYQVIIESTPPHIHIEFDPQPQPMV